MSNDTPNPTALWTPCPTVFNERLKGFLGFELFDLYVLVTVLFGGFLLRPLIRLPAWIPLVLVLGAALILWKGKRGKPRGALQHTLHHYDLLPLPGLLPPTEQVYHPWS